MYTSQPYIPLTSAQQVHISCMFYIPRTPVQNKIYYLSNYDMIIYISDNEVLSFPQQMEYLLTWAFTASCLFRYMLCCEDKRCLTD
jgi:hypothetical protein